MARFLSSTIINLKVTAASENNPGIFLSVSIGVATSTPQPDDLLVDLYKTVDKALYRAKRAGRNCISFNNKIIKIGVPAEASFPVGVLSASTTSGDAEN